MFLKNVFENVLKNDFSKHFQKHLGKSYYESDLFKWNEGYMSNLGRPFIKGEVHQRVRPGVRPDVRPGVWPDVRAAPVSRRVRGTVAPRLNPSRGGSFAPPAKIWGVCPPAKIFSKKRKIKKTKNPQTVKRANCLEASLGFFRGGTVGRPAP